MGDLKKVLKKINYILTDTEGTLNIGYARIGNMSDTLDKLRAQGKKIVFFTNDSAYSAATLTERLKLTDIIRADDIIYTSVTATVDYIRQNHPGKTCFVAGAPDIAEEFEAAGIPQDDISPEIVVITRDVTVSYVKLVKAVSAINSGAFYIATNAETKFHSGEVLPDCGAFAGLIEAVTGRRPQAVIGAPAKFMGENIMQKLGCNADEILIVGDRLTGVRLGIDCGFYTLIVKTGETDEKILRESDIEPDFVLESLNDIADYIE